jgi:Spy/CpxP family protein refolding chaperone
MNRKILVTTIAVSAVLVFAVVAFAQSGGPGHGRGAGMGRMGRGGGMCGGPFYKDAEVAKALGLSKDQIDKLEKLDEDAARAMIDTKAAMQKAMLDFHLAMRGPKLDEKKAKAAVDAVAAAKKQMMYKHVEQRVAVDAVLTADQSTKLQELMPQRCRERAEHRGQRRGGGDWWDDDDPEDQP